MRQNGPLPAVTGLGALKSLREKKLPACGANLILRKEEKENTTQAGGHFGGFNAGQINWQKQGVGVARRMQADVSRRSGGRRVNRCRQRRGSRLMFGVGSLAREGVVDCVGCPGTGKGARFLDELG